MDATIVHANACWVLAELIRVFHGVATREAQETVDCLVERPCPLVWEIDGKRRVLDPAMNSPDKVLLILYGEPGWLSTKTLCNWVKYSNASVFRTKVLKPLAGKMLIEFSDERDEAIITPLGIQTAETRLLRPL
jgi:hypothetical protein